MGDWTRQDWLALAAVLIPCLIMMYLAWRNLSNKVGALCVDLKMLNSKLGFDKHDQIEPLPNRVTALERWQIQMIAKCPEKLCPYKVACERAGEGG